MATFATFGGLLLVEMANKDGILRVLQERGWDAVGDLVQLEKRRFDSDCSHMVDEWTLCRREGNDLTCLASAVIDHRIYGPDELAELAKSAGWSVEGVYGGLKLEPLEPISPGTECSWWRDEKRPPGKVKRGLGRDRNQVPSAPVRIREGATHLRSAR